MNFHQLKTFHTVARLGSFSRAAEEMSVSQPAVSAQVKELEKAMGGALLNRTRGGVQLTDTGRAAFDYAQRIFSLAEEMQSAVHQIQGLKSGRLTIGSSTTPGEYILPGLIGRFRKRYPGIEVSLSISNTQTIVRRMHRRDVSLGLAGAPVEDEGFAPSRTYRTRSSSSRRPTIQRHGRQACRSATWPGTTSFSESPARRPARPRSSACKSAAWRPERRWSWAVTRR